MHRGRLLLVLAAALGALSIPLPFLSAEAIDDVAGADAGGWLALAALGGAALVALTGDRRDNLTGLAAVAAGAAVTLAVVVTGALVIDAVLAAREAVAAGVGGAVGPGLWLLATASGAGAAGVVVGMSRRLS